MERLWGVPAAAEIWFLRVMKILDRLIGSLRGCCHSLPDLRQGGGTRYTMADIGLSAVFLFFLQNPSFLAHQRRLEEGQGRSNCQTLFGLDRIPSDNHIRALRSVPTTFIRSSPRWWRNWRGPGGFPPAWRPRADRPGRHGIPRVGQGPLPAVLDPQARQGQDRALPRDGVGDGRGTRSQPGGTAGAGIHRAPGRQREAGLRKPGGWFERHGRRHARLKPIYLGDDLFSRQPVCEAVRAVDGHFLFVCKPASHQTIEEYLTGVDLPTLTRTVKRGRQWFEYRYRWLSDVPLRGDALVVNWLMIEIVNAAGEVTYRNSFVTDLDVGHDTVVELAACGRARWKIENESFNVLKNNGYNLEHNFGHGKVNLSAVFVSLNLLAFAFHTVCDFAEDLWRRAMKKMGTRFFENLRSITTFLIFPTWDDLLTTSPDLRPLPFEHHAIPSFCPI